MTSVREREREAWGGGRNREGEGGKEGDLFHLCNGRHPFRNNSP